MTAPRPGGRSGDWRPIMWASYTRSGAEVHDHSHAVGRRACRNVSRLRTLANRLEQLSLEGAVDALVFVEPVLADLAWQAARALERAPRNTAASPRA